MIVIAVGLVIGLGCSTVYRAALSRVERTDFTVYRAAGRAVLDGSNIYAAHNQRGWLFMALPMFAIAMVPFARLSVFWGALLWYLLSAAMVAHALHLSGKLARRAFPGCRLDSFWLYALAGLLVLPQTMSGITRGQPALLVMYLVTLAVWLSLQQRDWWAALCLAGSIVVKVFPLLLGVYFLFKRRWTMTMATAVWLVVLVAGVPSLVFGPRGNQALLRQWLSAVAVPANSAAIEHDARFEQTFDPQLKRNQSVSAVMIRWFTAGQPDAAVARAREALARRVATVVTVALLLVLAWACWPTVTERSPRAAALQFGAVLPAMVFLSPVGWNHYYTLLTLPLAVAVAAAASTRDYRMARVFQVGLAIYFAMTVLALVARWPQVLGVFLIGTLALWSVVCVASARETSG